MAGGCKILIIDDDAALRHLLAEQLHEEFQIAEGETGAAALDMTRAQHCDAILVDVDLPDMDGRKLCRLMRAPILLTGADGVDATILGLDSGANDYITKPFRLNVLLARLRAQRRQHPLAEDAVFTIGPNIFRPWRQPPDPDS